MDALIGSSKYPNNFLRLLNTITERQHFFSGFFLLIKEAPGYLPRCPLPIFFRTSTVPCRFIHESVIFCLVSLLCLPLEPPSLML